MNMLRREIAPLSEEMWQAVDDEVRDTLGTLLTARRVVDFSGPHGYGTSSVGVGRLASQSEQDGVSVGIRRLQPMVEVRVEFELSRQELDNMFRGAKDVDLGAATEAAKRLASFEERLIYEGFEQGGVPSLVKASEHSTVSLGEEPHAYVQAVGEALKLLSLAGIGGPFTLVLGVEGYQNLASDVGPYSSLQRIRRLIDGPVLQSAHLQGGLLVSTRGGDFQLDVGQDVSVGYKSHTATTVSLFLLETLTFRVFNADAVVRFA